MGLLLPVLACWQASHLPVQWLLFDSKSAEVHMLAAAVTLWCCAAQEASLGAQTPRKTRTPMLHVSGG